MKRQFPHIALMLVAVLLASHLLALTIGWAHACPPTGCGCSPSAAHDASAPALQATPSSCCSPGSDCCHVEPFDPPGPVAWITPPSQSMGGLLSPAPERLSTAVPTAAENRSRLENEDLYPRNLLKTPIYLQNLAFLC